MKFNQMIIKIHTFSFKKHNWKGRLENGGQCVEYRYVAAYCLISSWFLIPWYILFHFSSGDITILHMGGCLMKTDNSWHAMGCWKSFNFMLCDLIVPLNTLRLTQNGWSFPDDIFKSIFLYENVLILIKISLKCVSGGPIDKKVCNGLAPTRQQAIILTNDG